MGGVSLNDWGVRGLEVIVMRVVGRRVGWGRDILDDVIFLVRRGRLVGYSICCMGLGANLSLFLYFIHHSYLLAVDRFSGDCLDHIGPSFKP